MRILGIGGGLDHAHECNFEFPVGMAHDSAAVLLVDGVVVAAIEEERLNRIKHSNKAPIEAMKFCLKQGQLRVDEIDRFAVYGNEGFMNQMLQRIYLEKSSKLSAFEDARALVRGMIRDHLDFEVDPQKIIFVPHHTAHAASAFYMSGFEESLIVTIDGQGDGISGMVFHGNGTQMSPMNTVYENNSLGFFYLNVIKFLGYSMFDEYKVMGLAPYGDATKYKAFFKRFYTLLPDGGYTINWDRIQILFSLGNPRRKGESFTQLHKDIAAALQEALEVIVFHVLRYYQEKTGLNRLCLAGGVAHNCTLNGKMLYANLFEEVFIQPAAHDAGSVLGAALQVYYHEYPEATHKKLEHIFWGTEVGKDEEVEKILSQWSSLIEFERKDDIEHAASQLLADGNVLGWVQGRSEFGPRALGNRSIIADPRPAENKQIINAMVKKREGYRPFAPSVLEEEVGEYFDLPSGDHQFNYMIHVLKVREDKQQLLGAITHVDGTARVQTVSRETNPSYWKLIRSFQEKTGVPVILNTSFNNHAEPIVDSINDAIVCYMTTNLHGLVIGNYLIRKKAVDLATVLADSDYITSIPTHVRLYKVDQSRGSGKFESTYRIGHNYSVELDKDISHEVYQFLQEVDGVIDIAGINVKLNVQTQEQSKSLIDELINLWSNRLIIIHPPV